MHKKTRLVFALVLPLLGACDKARSPLQPVPQAPTVPTAPTAPQPPAMVPAVVAQLTLSNIRMEVFSGSTASGEPWLWYAPRFRLTENSGLSGAVINRVVVRAPDGDTEEVDQLCWVRDIRVARGGVAEVFGDNAQDLVYCRPGLSYPIPIPFVLLEVTYADDNGRRATVVAQIATASAVAQF